MDIVLYKYIIIVLYCSVYNSVKCVYYFYNQVNSLIIIYLSHYLNVQPIL